MRSQGFELEGSADLFEHLDVTRSYTYTDMKVLEATDGSEGKVPSTVPKHMASVWGAYRFGSKQSPGLRLGAGARYIGETFGDDLNHYRLPSYTLVDLSADYELPHVKLSFNVKNVADRHYLFSYTGGNYAFFGAGRVWQAGVRILW